MAFLYGNAYRYPTLQGYWWRYPSDDRLEHTVMKRIIDSYANYHLWANKRTAKFLSTLDEKILGQKVDSSFPSILHTLSHINKVHDFWLGFIITGKMTEFDWADRDLSANYQITEFIDSSEKMTSTFKGYDQVDLEKILELRSSWASYDENRFHFIMHVINHTTFHRGQLISIARILGVKDEFPKTDYLAYFAKELPAKD